MRPEMKQKTQMRSKCQRGDECGFAGNSICRGVFSVWLYLMDGERNSYFSKSPGHFVCCICHADSSTRQVSFSHLAFWKPPPSRQRWDGASLKATRDKSPKWPASRDELGRYGGAGVCEYVSKSLTAVLISKCSGGFGHISKIEIGVKTWQVLRDTDLEAVPGRVHRAALKISGGVYRADVSLARGGAGYRLICGEGFVLAMEMLRCRHAGEVSAR